VTVVFPLDGTARRPWSRSDNGRVHTGAVHRLLGIAAVLSGIMTFLALGAGSLLAAPLAIALAVTAFWWNLTRPGGMGARTVATLGPCRGCPHGCVECRERIDV
jgi:hypothetical protein